jgi:hypothetical protein
LCYPVCSSALVGVAFGGKVGYANYKGDILPASGDVGNSFFYGAVLQVNTLPLVDLEFHANYFSKDFLYSYDVGGVPVEAAFDFTDFHLLALAKKNLISLPGSPFQMYVGGGVGWHLLNTEVARDVADTPEDPSLADNPIALFDNHAKMSGHGLAGVTLSVPVLPFAIYGEGRYGVIFTDEKLKTLQIEAGLMFSF